MEYSTQKNFKISLQIKHQPQLLCPKRRVCFKAILKMESITEFIS